MLPDPPRGSGLRPSVYRAARLLYHENPPTLKIDETPVSAYNYCAQLTYIIGTFSTKNVEFRRR